MQPRNEKGQYQTYKPAPRTTSALLRKLYNEVIYVQPLSIKQISKRAGVDDSTLFYWLRGTASPRLIQLESVVEALGYRLDLVPLDRDSA